LANPPPSHRRRRTSAFLKITFPPEVLREEEDSIGLSCHLWALGCTLFEIRQQIPLFYMIFGKDELLAEMVRLFGKLPERLWNKWESRGDLFNDQGECLRDGDIKEEWTLKAALRKPMETVQPSGNYGKTSKMALVTSEAEQELIADLLYKLFCYESGERVSAEEVVEHGWFKM
jgi:serine/threonine protein kinase